MVTEAEKKRRKKQAEQRRIAEEKKRKAEAEEYDEGDYEEEGEETDDYVSPLTKKFSNVQNLGNGVLLVHDLPNDRVLLDVDYGTRRGISSTTKTVKIANGTYPIEEGMKLSLNVYDKNFTDEELVEKEKILVRKAKEVELALKQKEIAKKQAALDTN